MAFFAPPPPAHDQNDRRRRDRPARTLSAPLQFHESSLTDKTENDGKRSYVRVLRTAVPSVSWQKRRRFRSRCNVGSSKQNRHATTPFCASWQSTYPAKNGPFFWSFPYVCPEPVLVKCSFLCMNGSKRGVFTHLHILVLIDFVLLTRSVETAGKNNGVCMYVCV